MRLPKTIFISFTVLAVANANLFPKLKEGWTFVPTKHGVPVPVNLVKLADMFKGPQQISFDAREHVTFEIYSLTHPEKPEEIFTTECGDIVVSTFNKSLPTRIYIHGYLETGSMKTLLNKAYLYDGKQNVNIIAVNWEKSSHTWNYYVASNRVKPIGIYLAFFIDALVKNGMASLDDIQLIGFSLGAHIAGIAGKHIKSGKLPKITGLDPAAPLFPLDKTNERLHKDDAKYVEVIHTSGSWLGIHEPIGTTDFYPNHGKSQVGCKWDFSGTCSHLRAYKYFAESIYAPVAFYGLPCASYEDMKKGNCGGNRTRMGAEPGNYQTSEKIYLLTTNKKSFFARGTTSD